MNTPQQFQKLVEGVVVHRGCGVKIVNKFQLVRSFGHARLDRRDFPSMNERGAELLGLRGGTCRRDSSFVRHGTEEAVAAPRPALDTSLAHKLVQCRPRTRASGRSGARRSTCRVCSSSPQRDRDQPERKVCRCFPILHQWAKPQSLGLQHVEHALRCPECRFRESALYRLYLPSPSRIPRRSCPGVGRRGPLSRQSHVDRRPRRPLRDMRSQHPASPDAPRGAMAASRPTRAQHLLQNP